MKTDIITLLERYGVTKDVLEVVLSLLDDDLYTKECAAEQLIKILKEYDYLEKQVNIKELQKLQETA
ncbi:hypothetical protein SH601_05465 [Gracilibacillus sp. S3-1-1]|uniref:Uncharacterized protein n=1 Tax=Gracilibacillus pellucidus TaxID=3095368 RepID=A0ACC6M393_9BACI|nr:hypothetical protein [Gracilibacillus sp. S3-1-1]MDX8045433.1 hypothetical protein [Gracilibacillus sp. S3-1-1]